MKMERINEDTIQVIISNDELEQEGITTLDLLSDHKRIENFFYDILDKVDTGHQFVDKSSGSLTFEVLPHKDGLKLLISRRNPNTGKPSQNVNDEDNDNQGSDNYVPASKGTSLDASKKLGKYSKTDDISNQLTRNVVVQLSDFDDLIKIANILRVDNGASNLYLYNGTYYLELIFFLNIDDTSDYEINNDLSLAYEYGNPTKVTSDFLLEHGKRIMDTSALELTRYYFK